jgi:hypothetical protein
MKKHIAIYGMLMILSSATAWPADFSPKPGEHEGKGYLLLGGGVLDIHKLNDGLSANGYSKFSDNSFSIGGGGQGVFRQLIIGGEGFAFITDNFEAVKSGKPYKTSLTGGCGFFNLGYTVFRKNSLSIYPLFGIGGGGYFLNITDRTAASFDDVLTNPGRSSRLNSGAFLLSASLGADYIISPRQEMRDGKRGGLLLGFRFGYIVAPVKSNWNLDNLEVFGGPKTGITGPFFHFMIGGAGISPARTRG